MGVKPSKSSTATAAGLEPRPSIALSTAPPTVVIEGRKYHNYESSSYCLPCDEEEQDRLNSQHFAYKALYNSNVLPTVESQLPSDASILDIGCGSGSWVMEMAIDHPNAHVTGIDMSDMFPATIRPENVTFQLCNILDGLPFEDNTFDFVHMRMLIAGLRTTEWPVIIGEIYRVLKPGGLVQLLECDFSDAGQSPLIDTVLKTLHRAMQDRGQDPFIATKLHELLREASFQDIQQDARTIEYGKEGDPIAGEMLWVWKSSLKSLKPFLAPMFLKNVEEYPAVIDRFIQESVQYNQHQKHRAFCARKP